MTLEKVPTDSKFLDHESEAEHLNGQQLRCNGKATPKPATFIEGKTYKSTDHHAFMSCPFSCYTLNSLLYIHTHKNSTR